MEKNRPTARKKKVTENGTGIEKKQKLSGLNPFGSGSIFNGGQGQQTSQGQQQTQQQQEHYPQQLHPP